MTPKYPTGPRRRPLRELLVDEDSIDDEEITHSVTCGDCGLETYEFERYCHRCGADRWDK